MERTPKFGYTFAIFAAYLENLSLPTDLFKDRGAKIYLVPFDKKNGEQGYNVNVDTEKGINFVFGELGMQVSIDKRDKPCDAAYLLKWIISRTEKDVSANYISSGKYVSDRQKLIICAITQARFSDQGLTDAAEIYSKIKAIKESKPKDEKPKGGRPSRGNDSGKPEHKSRATSRK